MRTIWYEDFKERNFLFALGIKPTHALIGHLVSKFGTLSTVGPITKTVEDAALVMNVIAKSDDRDWYSIRPETTVDYLKDLNRGVKGMRIAYSPLLGGYVKKVHPDIASAVDAAVQVFKDVMIFTFYPLNGA